MTKHGRIAALVAFAALMPAGPPARAAVLDKSAVIAGTRVNYEVVLPDNYDATKAYPAVMAFPPGSQDMRTTASTLESVYRAEAEKRGYIVISPAAPGGVLFFEGSEKIFPAFFAKVLADYKILGNKFHISGMSNGGISAFLIAATYPQYAWSVTGFPGLLNNATPAQVNALAKLCIDMYVGERDSGWRSEMEREAGDFRTIGYSVTFAVEKGQEHVIRTLWGAGATRLFDKFETSRQGCGK